MNSDFVAVKREKITPSFREQILKRDLYSCRYCGSKKEPFHLDHVYPVSKGGETSANNIVTSCVGCNAKKHNSVGMFPKPIGYFTKKPNISISSVLLVSFATACMANGLLSFADNEFVVGKISMYIGVFVLLFLTGKISTGR